jgi:hypothetical protein
LCLSGPLLGVGGSSGTLSCCPTPAVSLCCFTHIHLQRVWHWEFGYFSHPCSPGQVHFSTWIPLSVLDYCSSFMFFSFLGGGSVCPGYALDYVPRCGWGVVHGAHLFILQIHTSCFETDWQGEMAQHREAFHGLRVQDVTELDFDWCSVFCFLGEKEKQRK